MNYIHVYKKYKYTPEREVCIHQSPIKKSKSQKTRLAGWEGCQLIEHINKKQKSYVTNRNDRLQV